MAQFKGAVGFAESVQDPDNPDIYVDQITERVCLGDVLEDVSRSENSDDALTEDVTEATRISIVANQSAIANSQAIRYVMWKGGRWAVDSVTAQHPRLILTLGRVYDGPTPT